MPAGHENEVGEWVGGGVVVQEVNEGPGEGWETLIILNGPDSITW